MLRFLRFGVLALLGGCAAVSGPSQDVILRLDPPLPSSTVGKSGQAILLTPVHAEGPASGRRYTYIDPAAPREVRQARTLFWEEPPALMLDHALAKGLARRLGRPVLTGQAVPGTTQRVSIELERFEEHSGPRATALVALSAKVIDWKSKGLIFAAHYCAESQIVGKSSTDRTSAFENAAVNVIDRLATDITRDGASSSADDGCSAAS